MGKEDAPTPDLGELFRRRKESSELSAGGGQRACPRPSTTPVGTPVASDRDTHPGASMARIVLVLTALLGWAAYVELSRLERTKRIYGHRPDAFPFPPAMTSKASTFQIRHRSTIGARRSLAARSSCAPRSAGRAPLPPQFGVISSDAVDGRSPSRIRPPAFRTPPRSAPCRP